MDAQILLRRQCQPDEGRLVALLNLRIGFDAPDSKASFYLEGRNLLDKRYIANVAVAGAADVSSAIFNPGTGIAIYGGAQFKW